MQNFFIEVFDYHHHFNRRIAEQLIDNQSVLQPRIIPLFSHMINSHQIWNARMVTGNELGVHQIHNLVECKLLDEENYRTTLDILRTMDLNGEVTYTNSRGDRFLNSVQDILFHISNHTAHHRGQIISDIRLSGLEPILTDYIFYKR